MSAGKVMRYTVVVLHPETNAPVALLAGKAVPKWAKDLIHADDLVKSDGSTDTSDDGDQGDQGFDEAAANAKWDAEKVPELKAEIEKRNADRDAEGEDYITPEEPGNKPELVAALVADDKALAG